MKKVMRKFLLLLGLTSLVIIMGVITAGADVYHGECGTDPGLTEDEAWELFQHAYYEGDVELAEYYLELIHSGILPIGGNMQWTLDTDTGVLTISGSGEMRNFTNDYHNPWYWRRDYVKKIIVEDGVTNIGDNAFACFSALESIELPSSVTSIGDYSFRLCVGLKSVSITENIKSIGSNAFSNCSALELIYWNTNNTAVDTGIFKDAGMNGKAVIGVNVTRIPDRLFVGAGISSFEFEEGSQCREIGIGAFAGCKQFKSITIPEFIEKIGNEAFHSCTGLEKIYYNAEDLEPLYRGFNKAGIDGDGIEVIIGSHVKKIPDYLFYENQADDSGKIVSVDFAEGSVCQSIGQKAFYGLNSLRSVTIPSSIQEFGERAFANCGSLEYVYYDAENAQNKSTMCIFGYAGHDGEGVRVTIGSNVVSIAPYLFGYNANWGQILPTGDALNAKVIELTFADGSLCENIGYCSFGGCTDLKKLIIPENIKSMTNSFVGCTSLQEIQLRATNMDDLDHLSGIFDGAGTNTDGLKLIIGANVVRIPRYFFTHRGAFLYTAEPKLVSIMFEDGSMCESIGGCAFLNIDSLTSVTFPDDMRLQIIEGGAFEGCTSLKHFELPNSVTYIGGSVFRDCTGLESFTVSPKESNLIGIGGSAFSYCGNLKSIILPHNLTSVGDSAFIYCVRLEEIRLYASLPDHDKFEEYFDFAGKDGEGIKLFVDADVTRIPGYLFSGSCMKLTSVEFEEGSACTEIGASAFEWITALKEIEIPPNVTMIAGYSFANCTGLEKIYYNATDLQTVGPNSFNNAGVEVAGVELVIGDHVTSIPEYCFSAREGSLGRPMFSEKITIPAGVTFLGEKAFPYRYMNEVSNLAFDCMIGWYYEDIRFEMDEYGDLIYDDEGFPIVHDVKVYLDLRDSTKNTEILDNAGLANLHLDQSKFTVTFVANGIVIDKMTYSNDNPDIVEPKVPENEHYTGKWEPYALIGGNIIVNAIYTPIEYNATFMVDETVVDIVPYNVRDGLKKVPVVPIREHYAGRWEPYLLLGGDITINAIYAPIEYTVTFVSGGNVVATESYDILHWEVNVPDVPPLEHYTGEWEPYSLQGADITVTAIYTPIEYTITFLVNDEVVAELPYTVLDIDITIPDLPEMKHYIGEWEDYSLEGGDVIVNAIFRPIEYSVVFVFPDGYEVKETYTIEAYSDINVPAPPDGYAWDAYEIFSCSEIVVSAVLIEPETEEKTEIDTEDGTEVDSEVDSEVGSEVDSGIETDIADNNPEKESMTLPTIAYGCSGSIFSCGLLTLIALAGAALIKRKE